MMDAMQGDAYALSVKIFDGDRKVVTPNDVRDVEMCVGSLRKTYKNHEIIFDGENEKNEWKFPLSQEETFDMLPSRVRAQVRVVWASGDVEGIDLGYIHVAESMSKEVL